MMTLLPTVAHLMGPSPHVADIIVYGGASIGIAAGLGLYFWGRHSRQSEPLNQPRERQPGEPADVRRVR